MKKLFLILALFTAFSFVNAQWSSQTSGVTTLLRSVSVVDANVCWMAGDGGKVLRTTNGGTTWTNVAVSPVPTSNLDVVHAIDANTALVACTPGATFVYRTTNAGATWTQVFTEAAGYIDDIGFKDANNGFIYGDPVGGRWSLWKSTNGGATWDSAGLYLPQAGAEAGWDNAMMVSGNNIWFGTNNTRVYYSTNFGASWQYGTTTGLVSSYNVCFNGLIGFAVGASVVLKSTNGGSTYGAFTIPVSSSIHMSTGSTYFFAVGSGTAAIYVSSNSGSTFASDYTVSGSGGNPWGIDSKVVGNQLITWSGGVTGGIYKNIKTVTSIGSISSEVPDKYMLSQNYPNPFNPVTKINFAVPKSGLVTLKVYDILGSEVSVLVNENVNAGTYSVDFNASSLSSGIYYYKMEANGYREVKKMSLIK